MKNQLIQPSVAFAQSSAQVNQLWNDPELMKWEGYIRDWFQYKDLDAKVNFVNYATSGCPASLIGTGRCERYIRTN